MPLLLLNNYNQTLIIMKKNYLIILFFCLLSSFTFAQTVANDDNISINSATGGSASIRTNDIINGVPGSQLFCSGFNVTWTPGPGSVPGIALNECGGINVGPGAAEGTYTFTYTICSVPAGSCDTATVTLTICSLDAPIVTIDQPVTCSSELAQLFITNLPDGNWTLAYTNQWGNNAQQITGSGNATMLALPSGGYQIRVTNEAGCPSETASVYIDYLPGIDASLNGTLIDSDSSGTASVGDVVSYQVAVTNLLDCPVNNITVVNSNMNTTGAIALLPANTIDATSIQGTYTLTQNDINQGSVSNYVYLSGVYNGNEQAYTKAFTEFSLDITSGILLKAFIDSNNNGVQDNGEQNFSGGTFTYQVNTNNPVELYSPTGTATLYENNPANVYSVTYAVQSSTCSGEYTVTTPTLNNITVPALSGITTYNFPVTGNSCADLAVYMHSNGAVPGFNNNTTIVLKNNGNVAIPSGSVTYTKPNATTLISVSESAATTTANGFTYSFTNLQPGAIQTIDVVNFVPPIPDVTLGDMLISSVATSLPQPDTNPDNDTFILSQVITGAYDPNDKTESHGGEIVHSAFSSDDYLTYTIRFENEGNGNAMDIRVEDILDAQLDATSVRMVTASHNYLLERTANTLVWKFNDIQLPPSVPDSDTGKGFIVFQVKPQAGYAVGDIIPNNAAIFFDTNPAIITNVAETEFVSQLGINDILYSKISVYPNPVKDMLTIENAENTLVKMYNQLGQLVLEKQLDNAQSQLNISGFAKGLYIINLDAATGTKTFKIVKE